MRAGSLSTLFSSFVAGLLAMCAFGTNARSVDPLPSWNEGASKARTVAILQAVTDQGGKDLVAPADRIAVSANDGCRMSAQPMYFHLAFAPGRVKALAAKNPEWNTRQPVNAAIEGGMKTLATAGAHRLLELVSASHADLTGAQPSGLVHHDEPARAFAHERTSLFGKLASGLVASGARGWALVSMKDDWKQVYAPAK